MKHHYHIHVERVMEGAVLTLLLYFVSASILVKVKELYRAPLHSMMIISAIYWVMLMIMCSCCIILFFLGFFLCFFDGVEEKKKDHRVQIVDYKAREDRLASSFLQELYQRAIRETNDKEKRIGCDKDGM